MKQCPQCQEEFADKFGFCPVDGTSLDVATVVPAQQTRAADDSVVTVSAPAAGPASSNGSDGHAADGNGAADGGGVPPRTSGATAMSFT